MKMEFSRYESGNLKLIRKIKSAEPTETVLSRVCTEKSCEWQNGTGACCLPRCFKGMFRGEREQRDGT